MLVAAEVGEPEPAEPRQLDGRAERAAQEMRTGMRRYRNSGWSVPFSIAGFSGSSVSSMTSVARHGVEPVEQELRVERDGDVGALELRLDHLVRVGPLLRDGRELETRRRSSPGGPGALAALADDLHRSTPRSSVLARDRQLVRVAARDQLLVVREVALDQACRDGRSPDTRTSPRARRASPRSRPAEQPLDLVERPRPDQHLLALARACPTPSRSRTARRYESVATRRRPARGRGQQHAGEDRAGVVPGRGRDHLAQRLRERAGVDGHRLLHPARSPAGTRRPAASRNAGRTGPPSIRASSPSISNVTVPGLELVRDRPSNSLAGTTASPSVSTWAGVSTRIVEIEVGADELDADRRCGDLDAGRAPASAPLRDGHGPLGGADRLGEGVALAAELHVDSSLSSDTKTIGVLVVAVVGPVDCG